MSEDLTDREILEACARACGIDGHRGGGFQSDLYFRPAVDVSGKISGAEWNPRTDDGDCFRMANKCELVVNSNQGFVSSGYSQYPFEEYFTPGNDAECRNAVCLVVARAQLAKEKKHA